MKSKRSNADGKLDATNASSNGLQQTNNLAVSSTTPNGVGMNSSEAYNTPSSRLVNSNANHTKQTLYGIVPSFTDLDFPGQRSIPADPMETKPQKKKRKSCLRQNVFLVLLIIGIAAGIGIGLGIRYGYPEFKDDPRNIIYLSFPGDLFLRMLKMCIVPLIVASLVSGMASLPSQAAGRISGYAMAYYMITTFMAVILGIVLVAIIQPGYKNFDADQVKENKGSLVDPADAMLDLIRNAFPSNIISACFRQTRTDYITVDEVINITKNGTQTEETIEIITGIKVTEVDGTNVIGLVVFSIALGVIVGRMGTRGLPLKNLFDCLQEAIIRLVKVIMWFSSIGVCFLLAGRIAQMKNPQAEFMQLGWYMLTVLVGLTVHGFLVLPLIYFFFTRHNPFRLMLHMAQALLTAFGTSSSSATLPITMDCIERKAGIHPLVSRFVLPVGATINMDGTALYEAVASIFIAQVNGYHLNAGQYITVSITATAAAVGAAGVPEAGLVTMIVVLTALGLPYDQIGLIFAVDWLLDRFRTMINVWGDSIGAGVVEKLSRGYLTQITDKRTESPQEKSSTASENRSYDDTEDRVTTKI